MSAGTSSGPIWLACARIAARLRSRSAGGAGDGQRDLRGDPAVVDGGGAGGAVHQVPVAGDDVQVLAVDRHRVAGGADQLGRGGPDPGRRAVVGVAVDALLVVVHEGVGALGVGELGDAAGQLEGVRSRPAPGGGRRWASRAGRSRGSRAAPGGPPRASRRPPPARRGGAAGPSRRGAAGRGSRRGRRRWRRRGRCARRRRRAGAASDPVKIASSSGWACRARTVWPRRSGTTGASAVPVLMR